MQSKENIKNNQEETPGEERETISLEEYSNMMKRLHELGGMNPSMQSWKEKESPVWSREHHSSVDKLRG